MTDFIFSNYFQNEKSNYKMTNDKKLFYASCFALITTALSFSLRAGVLPQIQTELGISAEDLGVINQMWYLGFPISMVIGGLVYHTVGGKRIMQFAFIAHMLGIILTIYSGSYMILIISTLLIGLGNGCTEAACNPMIADTYEGNMMSKMMNRFHMWFPGGMVVGSLLSQAMNYGNVGYQMQLAVMVIPTLIYAYLFLSSEWPKAKIAEAANIGNNLKAMLSPLFIFIAACMTLTAISEFGPQQWSSLILAKSGAQPMLILALVTGVMAVARYFGGDMVNKFNTTGVLLGSAILTTIGVYLLSTQTGGMVYAAAFIFALGVAYFWPNMIGFVADYIPESGALGMSIVGAVGMFMTGAIQPVFGGLIDSNTEKVRASGLTGDAADVAAGQLTMSTMALIPLALIVLFSILYFWMRGKTKATAVGAH